MARGSKGLTPEELARLGAAQLAELLAEACENDRLLRHRVEILHASKQGIDELEGMLARRIVSLSRARAFTKAYGREEDWLFVAAGWERIPLTTAADVFGLK
jgi:hypothetical protein